MSIDLTKFRIGPATVKLLAHGSGGGYHSSGEVLFETLVALSNTIGYTMNGAELTCEMDNVSVEPDQETFAVLHGAGSGEATLKLVLPASTALLDRVFGRAVSSVVERTLDGETFDTVGPGVGKPQLVSLLITQPRPGLPNQVDYLYIPRAMLSLESLVQVYSRKDVRTMDVEVKCYICRQNIYQTPDGRKPAFIYIEDSNVTFDKVWQAVKTITAETTVVFQHGTGYDLAAVVLGDSGDEEVILPSAVLCEPNNTTITFGSAQSGQVHLYLAGVSSDDATTGDSEIHWQTSSQSTWTLEATNFAYTSALVVLVFDEWGNQLTPTSVTITPGAVGVGQIEVVLATASYGRAIVIAEGPNGTFTDTFASSATWVIDASAAYRPWMMQFYNSSYVRMTDWTSITYDNVNENYIVTWPAARDGYGIGIY